MLYEHHGKKIQTSDNRGQREVITTIGIAQMMVATTTIV
jgi:hypothetical protein